MCRVCFVILRLTILSHPKKEGQETIYLCHIILSILYCFTLQAWIRMAINDGVLESYFDAMLTEPKLIRHFYQKTAYLRDPEHPGIFKTYIQGKAFATLNVFCTVFLAI